MKRTKSYETCMRLVVVVFAGELYIPILHWRIRREIYKDELIRSCVPVFVEAFTHVYSYI